MSTPGPDDYRPDILGEPFVARTIVLNDDLVAPPRRGPAASDERPPLTATLVRRGEPAQRRAILYVHGFSDYFFQAAHATRLARAGSLDFYALDLRRCGRSLMPHHDANDVRHLSEYDEELRAALEIVRSEGHEEVVLLGHSTGGLIATLFVHHHPSAVEGLVLNSPWFGLNLSRTQRVAAPALAGTLARTDPRRVIASLGPAYTASLHRDHDGAWDFDLELKPLAGFPVRAGWLHAVAQGQREIMRGAPLRVPTLLATSSRSGGVAGRKPTSAELRSADCVLDVEQMWAAVKHLGQDVTLRTVPGGLHDLALSSPQARLDYERSLLSWLRRHLG